MVDILASVIGAPTNPTKISNTFKSLLIFMISLIFPILLNVLSIINICSNKNYV